MRSPRLGLPVMPRAGTPGINPNAPDPMIGPQLPQGPGLGLEQDIAPAAPAPQMQVPQGDPDDLSGLDGVSKMGLLLGNVAAGLQGNMANSPVSQMQAQRRAMYERKRQAFVQSLQMVQTFNKELDSVPLSQRAKIRAGQRDVFERANGKGSGVLFDSLTSNDARADAITKMAEKSEGLKLMIAQDMPLDELAKFTASEQFQEEALAYDDNVRLPGLKETYKKFVNQPEVKARAYQLMKDGSLSLDDIKTLNEEFRTLGPGGSGFTAADLNVFERNEANLLDLDGFKPRAEIIKERDRLADEQSQIRINEAREKSQYEWSEKALNNKSGPQISPAMRDFLKLEHKEAVEAIANTDAALDYLKELDRSLNKAEAVLTDKPVDEEIPIKMGKIDVSDASDKRINTGKTRFLPGAGLTQSVTNTDDYSILEQAYGEEWVGKIRTSAPKGAFSDKEGVALERTIGGFGKGNPFNLRDIRERRQFLAELRDRKIEERRQATEKRASIAKRVELDDLGTSVTREGGSTGGAPKPLTPADRAEIKRRVDAGEMGRDEAMRLLTGGQ